LVLDQAVNDSGKALLVPARNQAEPAMAETHNELLDISDAEL